MYIRDKAGICELKDKLTETSQVKCKEEENEEKARHKVRENFKGIYMCDWNTIVKERMGKKY